LPKRENGLVPFWAVCYKTHYKKGVQHGVVGGSSDTAPEPARFKKKL
jgi:hypothetical protein